MSFVTQGSGKVLALFLNVVYNERNAFLLAVELSLLKQE